MRILASALALATSMTLVTFAQGAPATDPAPPEVKLVLLGTAGGPTPKRTRSAPAQALRVGDDVYVIDCGNGVGRQMALAGLPFKGLRHVFVTHHHSDHVADLVTLPLLAWSAGLEHEVVMHGPPPLRTAARSGLRAAAFDIETRTTDEGRTTLGDLLRVHEIRKAGVVLRDGAVTVRAARVEHPPIHHAYAYRFDTPGGSFVFSGDTAPCASLIELARDADVLVHEVLMLDAPGVSAWIGEPVDHPLVRHIVGSHTHYRELGRIASEARVKRLVLSHFVPGDMAPDEAVIVGAIRETYAGDVVLGVDLMELTAAPRGAGRGTRPDAP